MILVGWDGSDGSNDALELAQHLARVKGDEIAVETVPEGSSPARGLADRARELAAEMIVLGSTHRGAFGRLFPGTVADELMRIAPCSVAVAPRGYARRYANRLEHVVAAFDGSPEAEGAVGVACDLASRAHGSLELLAVLQPPVPPVGPDAGYGYDEIVQAKRAHLGEEVTQAVELLPQDLDCEARVVVRGDAARTLAEETATGVDLLVTGSRGYGMLGRALGNGVSSRLVRTAQCPVLVVPGRHPRA